MGPALFEASCPRKIGKHAETLGKVHVTKKKVVEEPYVQ